MYAIVPFDEPIECFAFVMLRNQFLYHALNTSLGRLETAKVAVQLASNPRISVTSTQSRHFFFQPIQLFSLNRFSLIHVPRQLNPRISVTSTQSRHFFFQPIQVFSLNRELFSRLDCSAFRPKKNFFLQRSKSIRALFAARVVATVQMVAFLCQFSRLSVTKEVIKSIDGFDESVIDHYSQ